MSKIRLSGSNSGYVEIAAAADAGNLTFNMPTTGTALFGNGNNVISGITTYNAALDINSSIDVSGTSVFNNDVTFDGATAGYDVVWDRSDNQLEFAANAKATFGNSQDMQLYHDGNHGYIADAGTGNLRLRSGTLEIQNLAGSKTSAVFSSGGGQTLNFNDSPKFVTTNTGAIVTGICTATSFSGNGDALSYSSALSNRNVIINGSMLISQRGSDFTSVGSSAYHLDRWYWYDQNSSCRVRIRHSGLSPDGFHQSYRINVTTADTSIASNEENKLIHKIEGYNLERFAKGTSGAKAFALSFYIKCNKNGTYIVELYDRDNNRDVSGSYTVSNSDWNRHTIIFPADTTGEFNFDANSSLEIMFWLCAGSAVQGGTLNTSWRTATDPSSATGQVNFMDSTSNEWAMTGVQLEPDFVTPFEHIPYVDELARCQRYFAIFPGRSGGIPLWQAYTGSNQCSCSLPIPFSMRATPTPTDKGTGTSTTTGYCYNSNGSQVNSRYANNNAPVLSCGGYAPSGLGLIMGFGSHQSGTNDVTVASWNGSSPGIFLDAEL